MNGLRHAFGWTVVVLGSLFNVGLMVVASAAEGWLGLLFGFLVASAVARTLLPFVNEHCFGLGRVRRYR